MLFSCFYFCALNLRCFSNHFELAVHLLYFALFKLNLSATVRALMNARTERKKTFLARLNANGISISFASTLTRITFQRPLSVLARQPVPLPITNMVKYDQMVFAWVWTQSATISLHVHHDTCGGAQPLNRSNFRYVHTLNK